MPKKKDKLNLEEKTIGDLYSILSEKLDPDNIDFIYKVALIAKIRLEIEEKKGNLVKVEFAKIEYKNLLLRFKSKVNDIANNIFQMSKKNTLTVKKIENHIINEISLLIEEMSKEK